MNDTATYGRTLPDLVRTLGTVETVGGNESFPLHGADRAWYVHSGRVDVFSVALENGEPAGPRSYFFTAEAGELLLGIDTAAIGLERTLLAVPTPNTGIVRIGLDDVRDLLSRQDSTDAVVELLDRWIGHLSQSISRDINPRTDAMIEAGGTSNFAANLKVRSRKGIVWMEFVEGNALFLGMKEVRETGERRVFPVSQDSWLQTMEAVEIRSHRTADLCRGEDFWRQLANFHDIIFFCEFFNTRLLSVDEYNRLNEKAGQSARVRSTALANIASVMNEHLRRSWFDAGEDPLLAACRLVADHAGIPITAPSPPKTGENRPLVLGEIVRASRFRARKVRLAGNWWEKDNGPLLAFTKDTNAPVALVPRSPGAYDLVRPTEGTRRRLTEEDARGLAAEAHQFYRPFPDHPIKGFHLFKFGVRSCIRDLALVILVGLAGGALTLLVPVLTGTIFDAVIPQTDHRQLFVYALVIFFSAVAIGFFQLVRSFAMIRIETKLDFTLQSAIWDRLLNLPVPFFRGYQAGELAAKANSIMMLRKILSDTVIYSVLGAVFMSFNYVLLFYYDATLGVAICGFLGVTLAVIVLIGRRIQNRQRNIIQLQNRIFGMLIQFLSSISKIRIAGAEVHAFSQWAAKFSESKRDTYIVRKLFLSISVITTALPLVLTLVVFGAIARRGPGSMSTGEFIAFYTALTMTVLSFLQIAMAGMSFFTAIPLLESIRPILETLPENVALKADIPNLSGEIEVVDVSFRYQPDAPLVLENVSLHVRPGEFIAIVGASGSGKSTLLRMLLGFETPELGSVYYDRQDLASFDPTSIRRQAGTVLQQSTLSAGNILTNITGMTNATFEDAWEAARCVGLDEDIKQMPMGMYTVITGGLSTLSGGQRQRIMIARAIVSKPRILFFDEATSALDNRTQEIVSASLERLQATRIVIAHRLTTVRNADRIYLMEHGRIVESGTYDELLAREGRFTDLVKRQVV